MRRRPRPHHRDGRDEIDIVLENRGGELTGIQVTASASLDAANRRAPTKLRGATANRFHAGVVATPT